MGSWEEDVARVEWMYADYFDAMGKVDQFPHCDQYVLHAPGECVHCDWHPDWQALRENMLVAFTGHTPQMRSDHIERPCPAERLRGIEKIHRWGGNIPITQEDLEERDHQMEELLAKYPEVLGG